MTNMYQQRRKINTENTTNNLKLTNAGKVNILKHNGKEIIVPNIDYMNSLESELKQLRYLVEQTMENNRKLSVQIHNLNKISKTK